MKLLLQAGIHLIKKVITFVIYGRSVQVFKACTLFYFFSAEFFFSQIFLRGKVLSHRFHRYTQIFFIMIFLHRISRMNRKAFLLAGLLTDFRGILAAGQWLAPYICSCCFGHADFADDADFSSLEGFVPQISQIYTDFLHHDFSHRISRMNRKAFLLIGLLTDFRGILAAGQWLAPYICSCFFVTQISLMTQIFLRGEGFVPQISQILHRFFMESLVNLFVQSQGVSATTGQVASAKIRE